MNPIMYVTRNPDYTLEKTKIKDMKETPYKRSMDRRYFDREIVDKSSKTKLYIFRCGSTEIFISVKDYRITWITAEFCGVWKLIWGQIKAHVKVEYWQFLSNGDQPVWKFDRGWENDPIYIWRKYQNKPIYLFMEAHPIYFHHQTHENNSERSPLK